MVRKECAPDSIYIEGTDCCGKTSVADILTDNYHFDQRGELYLCPDNPWKVEELEIEIGRHPVLPVFLAKSVLWDLEHFDGDGTHLQVSFILIRSAAWQRASGEPLKDIFEDLIPYCPFLGSRFLLETSITEKQRRLRRKLETEPETVSEIDMLTLEDPDFVQSVDEELGKIMEEKLNAKRINTSEVSIDQVVDIILGCIQKDGVCQRTNAPELDQRQFETIEEEVIECGLMISKEKYCSEELVERVKAPVREL
jgi:hypothetical protein